MTSVPSTLTDDARNLMRDWLKQQIKYIAIGTGSTTPTIGDHQLVSEVFRKPVSSLINGTNAGELIAGTYVGAGELVGIDIAEVAAFAGDTATGTPNSGVMVARGLWSHPDKLFTEGIISQIDLQV